MRSKEGEIMMGSLVLIIADSEVSLVYYSIPETMTADE